MVKNNQPVGESQSIVSIMGAGYRMSPDLKMVLRLNSLLNLSKKSFVDAEKFALTHVKKRATARDLASGEN